MANPRSNRAIHHLIASLNAAEMTYPGTDLKLKYSSAAQTADPIQASYQNPGDQEI
jgi:hypothetical protein